MEEIIYPVRINRFLALKKYCSRREADVFISKGIVKINGKNAKIGDTIKETDKVEVALPKNGKLKDLQYLAYNKPLGIVTHSPQKGEKSIAESLNIPKDIFPIGRLDKESSGLIILSNDGRLTDRLLNPENEHEKEYTVRVNKEITNIFLKVLGSGIQLEDFKTKPCQVKKKDEFTFNIILTEGKKHQIRRMCAAFGYSVVSLKRIRIMNIKLENLKIGKIRKIETGELQMLLEKCDLK
jgi:23S rRNA pseudouridine2604 synthase